MRTVFRDTFRSRTISLIVLPFQRHDLRLGQHQAFLSAFGLQRLEPLVHGFKIVAQPQAARAGR